MPQEVADVCLVAEGTYPYVSGGVSSWAHDLICQQPHLRFHVLALLAPRAAPSLRFRLPANVTKVTAWRLQDLPRGSRKLHADGFYHQLERILSAFHESAGADDLASLISLFQTERAALGQRTLLDSQGAWDLVKRMYRRTYAGGSFVDYFWSWRSIFGGLFSILLPPVPKARCYHALCTGFAGLFAARAAIETGRPALLTEHGIYTNERRIELGMAMWLREVHGASLSVNPLYQELQDLWARIFASYSRVCYEVSNPILTLFSENQSVQELEGADRSRLRIIPNGIDYKRFSQVRRDPEDGTPTIALVGRVVPIKGVKTFIMAVQQMQQQIPELRALVLGSYDEDDGYMEECSRLVEQLGLSKTISFVGEVKLEKYFSKIDVLVLTSLSEAQPLVILEAGAAGIPSVVTNVGACRELIMGRQDEEPSLGAGGAVVQVSDQNEIAASVVELLRNPELRKMRGEAMRRRVQRYYTSAIQESSYRDVYADVLMRGVKEAGGRAQSSGGASWPV